jgi:hypothetical protein
MESSNFCRSIEKRVRKHLRLNKLFSKGDRIYVKDSLSKLFINRIIGELPKSFVKNKKRADKIVIKRTMDDDCDEFLEHIMFNKKIKDKNGISVLSVITDKEAILFAKYHSILFKPNKKNKNITNILDELERLYPQIRYSLAKSVVSLGCKR